MTIFSDIFYSIRKSRKLTQLQRKISPPGLTVDDLISRFHDNTATEALKEFMELCANDKNVKPLMAAHNLSKTDLINMYHQLLASGAGQWIKGHYCALSTIAYHEPLYFYIMSKKKNISDLEIVVTLLDYWEGKIKQGHLSEILGHNA